MLGPTSFSQQATLCEGLLVKSNHIYVKQNVFVSQCIALYHFYNKQFRSQYRGIEFLPPTKDNIKTSGDCPKHILRTFSAWSCNPAPPYMPSINDWIMLSWERYESKSLRTHEKYSSLIETIAQG